MAARKVKGKSRGERKAELMAYLEQKVEGVLDRQEKWGEMDLWRMEEMVEEVGRAMQSKLVESLISGQRSGPSVSERCPEWGQPVNGWGGRKRAIETSVGSIELEREYYNCRQCRTGFSPSGANLRPEPPSVE